MGLGLVPGPGWAQPEETLAVTLGIVVLKQAGSGPRSQRESHPAERDPPQGLPEDSPFSARWTLSAGSRVAFGRQGQ